MGCDIHLHAERRWKGKWLKIASPDSHRDYDLFWILGGIRRRPNDEIPPIASDRGIPRDAAAATKKEYKSWDGDAHSANWLSLSELREHVEKYPQLKEESPWFWVDELRKLGLCNLHPDCVEAGEEMASGCITNTDDVRLVFWFDN